MEAENFNFGEGKLFRIPHPHVLHGRTRRAISHAKMPRSGAETLQSSAEGQFRGASGNGKLERKTEIGKLERKNGTENGNGIAENWKWSSDSKCCICACSNDNTR